MLNLPNITAVSKDDWDIHGFDELNVLKVVHVGTGEDPDAPVYDFFINTDNKYLLHSQKGSPNNSELLRKQFIYGFVLVGLALLQEHQKKGTSATEPIEDYVLRTSRALGTILIPMLQALGALTDD